MADDPHGAARPSDTPAAPSPTAAPANATPLSVGILCPDCGYDLRGSTSERCPECGFLLEPLRTGESQIPWSHRAQLGRFRAYWKTVWLVTARPKRFCQEMARPVSYADSQRFRWVTALHAYLPLLAGAVAWVVCDQVRGWKSGEAMWWTIGSVLTVALLLFAALPGLASYFFQPRRVSVEQQNRAVALSYYAGAPLGWTLLALPALVGCFVSWTPAGYASGVLLCVAVGLYLGALFGWELKLHVFFRHILHDRRGARLLKLLLVNVLAFGVLLLFVLVPCSVFCALVIFHSLR